MSEEDNTVKTEEKPEREPNQKTSHTVVGVRFKSCGKIYNFEIGDINLAPGTRVVVDSEMGLGVGYVVVPKFTIERTGGDPLKKVLRVATEKDLETVESNRSLQEEARAFCAEKAKEYNLEMKVVTTETTLDRKRLVFYFTADGRIDFRELVRDLASKFKTRIEMRQIGVRDEVKLIGGLGACGRQACCNLFLTSFAPITIRMAKEQDLSINQSKLSGICGRLMCCLGYEHMEGGTARPRKAYPDESAGLETDAGVSVEISAPGSASVAGKSGEQPAAGTDALEEKPSRKKRRRRRRPQAPRPSDETQPGKGAAESGKQPEEKPKREQTGKKRRGKRRKSWKKKKGTDAKE